MAATRSPLILSGARYITTNVWGVIFRVSEKRPTLESTARTSHDAYVELTPQEVTELLAAIAAFEPELLRDALEERLVAKLTDRLRDALSR